MNDEERKYFEQFHKRLTSLEQNGIPGVRDFFATSALSVLSNWEDLSNLQEVDVNTVAKFCYAVADAMIIERDKK
jgi:hypothetical protein